MVMMMKVRVGFLEGDGDSKQLFSFETFFEGCGCYTEEGMQVVTH